MTRAWIAAAVGLSLTAGLLTGCNVKPYPPRTEGHETPKVLSVNQSDTTELAAVTAVEQTRINYEYRLEVLQGYYYRVGNMDKYNWARDELDNLRTAQTFQWQGIPAIHPPEGESVEDADERLLVEYAVAARREYLDALDELIAYYDRTAPDSYKALRVRNVGDRLYPERMYAYFKSAEVPPESLRPTEVIPEAERLYADALKLHQDGKGITHTFLTTNYAKQRQALTKFLQLVRQYPSSTKIALAAYYIGDIYKEYFDRDLRAVMWYERAWQWDPDVVKPARFQAATVYDLRLQNKSRAIELYQAAIEHEQFNESNVIWARRRVRQLLGR